MAEGSTCPLSPGTILECAGRTRLRVKRTPTKDELETMFGPDIAFLWDVYALCDPAELTDEAKDLHILARSIFEEVQDEPGRSQ